MPFPLCAYRRESGLFLPKRNWTTFLAQELLAAPVQSVRDGHAELTKQPICALGCPWVDYRRSHCKQKGEEQCFVGKGIKKMPEEGHSGVHFQIGRIKPISNRSPHLYDPSSKKPINNRRSPFSPVPQRNGKGITLPGEPSPSTRLPDFKIG
jgi:hypothetical protein